MSTLGSSLSHTTRSVLVKKIKWSDDEFFEVTLLSGNVHWRGKGSRSLIISDSFVQAPSTLPGGVNDFVLDGASDKAPVAKLVLQCHASIYTVTRLGSELNVETNLDVSKSGDHITSFIATDMEVEAQNRAYCAVTGSGAAYSWGDAMKNGHLRQDSPQHFDTSLFFAPTEKAALLKGVMRALVGTSDTLVHVMKYSASIGSRPDTFFFWTTGGGIVTCRLLHASQSLYSDSRTLTWIFVPSSVKNNKRKAYSE